MEVCSGKGVEVELASAAGWEGIALALNRWL